MTKEQIKKVVELFVAWNDDEVINVSNLDYAIDYLYECLKDE